MNTRALCPKCFTKLSVEQLAYVLMDGCRVRCGCGMGITIDNARLVPDGESLRRADPMFTTSFTWFHGTLVDDWFSKVVAADVSVHVGERSASDDILIVNHFFEPSARRFYMWELEFVPDAVFSNGLHGDEDDDSAYPVGVASVYLNRFESPGSVSVFTPARFLRVQNMVELSLEEVMTVDSIYHASFDSFNKLFAG